MAKFGQKFDASEIDTTQNNFELLPTGIYRLEVSSADIKNDDFGNTSLNVAVDVIEPEDYAGRRFFLWIDIEHKDAEYQQRGQKELAKLCRSMSLSEVDDTEDLMFKAFTAKVKKGESGVGKKSGKPYKARNSISLYFYPDEGNIPEPAIDENQPKPATAANDNRQAARPAAAATPAKDAAAGGARPWGKR